MIERDIEIEFEAEKISIEAVIWFAHETIWDGWRHIEEYLYHPKHTKINRVVNLELNEGAPPIPTTMKHYKMLKKHWENHDVYFEI